ncbi:MAG: hypothetical protein R3D67_02405 [Hyphomicrobiaceae bacterium]
MQRPINRVRSPRPVIRTRVWLAVFALLLVLGPALLLYAVYLRGVDWPEPTADGGTIQPSASASLVRPPTESTPSRALRRADLEAARLQSDPVPLPVAMPAPTRPSGLNPDGSLVPRKVTTREVRIPPQRAASAPQPDLIAGLLRVPVLLKEPRPATRPQHQIAPAMRAPAPVPQQLAAAASAPVPNEAAGRPASELDAPAETVAPPPAPAAAPATGARIAQAPPPPPASDPVVELAKHAARWDNTGRLDPAVVKQRLEILRNDTGFDHAATRFPLTGKHKRLDCASCHTSTLKDTPRQCIDCHKKDDAHRGRRPQCQECHVTTNWETIRRRR